MVRDASRYIVLLACGSDKWFHIPKLTAFRAVWGFALFLTSTGAPLPVLQIAWQETWIDVRLYGGQALEYNEVYFSTKRLY